MINIYKYIKYRLSVLFLIFFIFIFIFIFIFEINKKYLIHLI